MKPTKPAAEMTMREAIDEIERLRAENKRLRGFVYLYRKFAEAAVGDANNLLNPVTDKSIHPCPSSK